MLVLADFVKAEIGKTLLLNLLFSVAAGFASYFLIKEYIPIFIGRGFFGRDQCKKDKVEVAEPLGVVAAAVYLIFVFAFIPFPSYQWISEAGFYTDSANAHLPYVRLLSLLAGIISICTAILLGFADDMLDLRWRHKLLFPTLSSLPLLMVYYISDDQTAMLLPTFLQTYLNTTYLELGPLFYVYMAMLVIFCTNAINIIAGINGIEVGQSLVIAISVAIYNLIQIYRLDQSTIWYHCLSICLLGPFIGTSLGLFMWNRFPARVFVGDTYCYWAGMTLAVVAISGHFSKTLLLFLIPQIFNFLYSCPQLFKLVPCPRHRLPRLNPNTGKLGMSMTEFKAENVRKFGRLAIWILRLFGLLHYEEFVQEEQKWIRVNNMTILNLVLKFANPLYEYQLNNYLLCVQIVCSIFAFFCRFVFSRFFYETVH
ncbi:Glycosyltransferase, group 4 family [Aphelenchoides besseyi]|nr:Glycosyltransferase, group 4 family [Aphelenchoides besseyi]KAI6199905.1 Glycosyltransferase, group 4 family [Aphelenchoides besseyi]